MYKERICSVCGKTFQPNASNQKYCSRDCFKVVKNNNRNKFDRETIDNTKSRICLVCGKEIIITPNRIRKVYCSYECGRKAERIFGNKNQRDLDDHNNRKFSGKKYEVLKRDNYSCQMCGSEHQLVIHHTDETGHMDTPNNDFDNLVTLCRSCHAKLHNLNRRRWKQNNTSNQTEVV